MVYVYIKRNHEYSMSKINQCKPEDLLLEKVSSEINAEKQELLYELKNIERKTRTMCWVKKRTKVTFKMMTCLTHFYASPPSTGKYFLRTGNWF